MILNSNEEMLPDSSSITELFQRYAPAVFTYLQKHIKYREDAEDVLLDTFTAVIENRHILYWSEDEQRRWIWRVARNKMVDAYRKASRIAQVPLEDVLDDLFADDRLTPEQATLRSEEHDNLRQAMNTLPSIQQTVLKLRFVHGLRSGEIASQIGKSEGAVRTLLSRTLNVLRRIYKENE
jgi:RNA polymerase sigma-70 factor (ECF subfamily)